MMAEYVDNNEDGEYDDALVVQKMLGQKATLLLMTNESENDKMGVLTQSSALGSQHFKKVCMPTKHFLKVVVLMALMPTMKFFT